MQTKQLNVTRGPPVLSLHIGNTATLSLQCITQCTVHTRTDGWTDGQTYTGSSWNTCANACVRLGENSRVVSMAIQTRRGDCWETPVHWGGGNGERERERERERGWDRGSAAVRVDVVCPRVVTMPSTVPIKPSVKRASAPIDPTLPAAAAAAPLPPQCRTHPPRHTVLLEDTGEEANMVVIATDCGSVQSFLPSRRCSGKGR